MSSRTSRERTRTSQRGGRERPAGRGARARSARSARTRKTPVVWLGLAVVVGLAAVLAFLMGAGEDTMAAPVEVEGTDLPALEGASDPAIGAPAPALRGTGFDGEPVAVEPGSGPAVVLFLAHWCSVCQGEVPQVQAWVDGGGQPDGVELVAVATGNDSNRPNHPPDAWLEAEGWSQPTMLDDPQSSAARAYGLPAYPYWVFVDAEGAVVGRHAGALPVGTLEAVMLELAGTD